MYHLYGKDSLVLPQELHHPQNLLHDREIALKNKERIDKNRNYHVFNVNDLVYVENSNKINRHKLDEIRIGPFKIIRKISNSIFKIDCGHKKQESNLYHISKLLPYVPEDMSDNLT